MPTTPRILSPQLSRFARALAAPRCPRVLAASRFARVLAAPRCPRVLAAPRFARALAVGLLCCGAAAALTACSHIADDEQLLYVPPVVPPTPEPTIAPRTILIEDFTGQRCVNCPTAADEIQRIRQQYGDTAVVAVGIHSGPLAVFPTATVVGLRTTDGDAYYDHWGIDREPLGYINRTGTISTHDQWMTLVRQALQLPATLRLNVSHAYDEATRQLTIQTTATALQPYSGKLQLWITESGITALQMMPDGSINRDYQHNHVFRAAVNGLWGQDLTLTQGQEFTLTHTATVATDWQPQNLAIVAFAYNDQGVAQATEHLLDTKKHD